jgi:hypothetical protein
VVLRARLSPFPDSRKTDCLIAIAGKETRVDAVAAPSFAYADPPLGHIPAHCPSCGASLDHFLQQFPVSAVVEPHFVRETEQMAAAKAAPGRAVSPRATQERQPEPAHIESPPNVTVFDHPAFGGRITICALLFGNYTQLHRRCLGSILATVPTERLDLRVACNQVCDETAAYVSTLPVTKVYSDAGQRRKYPAMRQMFHDSAMPVQTKWLCWFDDDSYVRSPLWLTALAESVIGQASSPKTAMFGQIMFHPLRGASRDPRQWFRQAGWFKNRDFRDRSGSAAPNGDCIHFITGGFWCLSTAAMRIADIPDMRLNHNGGDICIGEQLWQNGYRVQMFNHNKALVHTSNHARRGYHEKFPWM